MKKNYTLVLAALIFSLGLIQSCGNTKRNEKLNTIQEEHNDKIAKNKEDSSNNCIFLFNESSALVKWTAFKFTEKTAVGGQFDESTVHPLTTEGSIAQILKGSEFMIPISSINSNNADRDAKIKEHFFGNLSSTSTLEGSILNAQGNDSAGTVTILLKMNQIEKEITGNYTVNDLELKITTELDVANWNANSGIAALNKVCDDLHKGADGISKLWSEVSVEVVAQIEKKCD